MVGRFWAEDGITNKPRLHDRPELSTQYIRLVWFSLFFFQFTVNSFVRRLSGVAQDYIHGEVLPKIARVAVMVLSASALGSLCYFNYFDIGFAKAVHLLYSQL